MDKAEQTGLGVAVIGHLALFGLLSVGFLATPNPLELKQQPVEVTLTDEIGLDSAAPDPSPVAPAPKLAEIEGPVEPIAEPIVEPAPQPSPTPPQARPKPVPKPQPKAQPKPRPAPPRAADQSQRRRPDRDVRPTGRLDGIVAGLNPRAAPGQSTKQQASKTAAQARKSIDVAIDQEIRPFWRPPSGADSQQLVTVLRFRLSKNGGLADEPELVAQRGRTDSNKPQQKLHEERAIRAIKLAAPFRLPAEYYDQWKTWQIEFDARLAR